jgi:hypothetical protein
MQVRENTEGSPEMDALKIPGLPTAGLTPLVGQLC